jgi:hypothetical protein
LLLSVINAAGCRFFFSLCASIAIDTAFGVAGKVRTDLGHADFDQARSAALQPDGKSSRQGQPYSITVCPNLLPSIKKTPQSWRVSAGLSALADEPVRKSKCAGQTKMKSKPQH